MQKIYNYPMKQIVPYIESQRTIRKKISANRINDLQLLDRLEKTLTELRGNIFRMPKEGTPVVAFMSGGLDTTVMLNMLLEQYKLDVYPLFINRRLPHEKKIKQSIQFFTRYFINKYPKRFHSPFEICLSIPPTELKSVLLQHENDIIRDQIRKGVSLQPSLYAHYAIFYAKYLEESVGIRPRTIFGAWLPSNSEWYGYESIVALRSIMLNLCCLDNDFAWQFTSLPMEKELGFYFDKDILIKIGAALHITLEKTWTCYRGGRIHCGACPPCGVRMESFQKAGVSDLTRYGDGLTIVQRVRKNFKINARGIT